MNEEAQNFGNRPIGKQLRNKVLTLIQQASAHRCVLDFGNIRLISSSFADEFVGKLAEQLGDRFSSFVTIDHISNDNAAILDKAIRERLAVARATQAVSSLRR